MWPGQSAMIQAKRVKQRGVEVVNCYNIADGFIAEVVSTAVGVTAFEAATSQPQRISVSIVIATVFAFVENTKVSSLGTFGLAILLYTVLKLLSSIERTFNDIWGVRRSRSLVCH